MSVKENVFIDRNNGYEEINRFRNGHITQPLTSVDIDENVISSGCILTFFEKFVCDTLEYNPFERFSVDKIAKRKNFYKGKKTLLQTLTKKYSNSEYGSCTRKDIEDSYEGLTQRWMKNEYYDLVKERFPLENGNIMVNVKDRDGFDDESLSRKKSSKLQLASLTLSHSKRLMNDVILSIDGSKNQKKITPIPMVCIYTTMILKS